MGHATGLDGKENNSDSRLGGFGQAAGLNSKGTVSNTSPFPKGKMPWENASSDHRLMSSNGHLEVAGGAKQEYCQDIFWQQKFKGN